MQDRELSIFFGVMLLATVLMLYTGWLGGGLVYEHGVGIESSVLGVTPDSSALPPNPL